MVQDPTGLTLLGAMFGAETFRAGLRNSELLGKMGVGGLLGGTYGGITGGLTGGWRGALAGALGGAVTGSLTGGLSAGSLHGIGLYGTLFGVGAGGGAIENAVNGEHTVEAYVEAMLLGGFGNMIGGRVMTESEAMELIWPVMWAYGMHSYDIFVEAFHAARDMLK